MPKFALLALSMLVSLEQASAQTRAAPLARRGVDLASLNSGHRLIGSILSHDARHTRIAVRRKWLEETYPKYYEAHVKQEDADRRGSLAQVRNRINIWLKERRGNEDLVRFLEAEKTRILRLIEAAERADALSRPRFVLINVPADQLKNHFFQPSIRKQVLLVAWQEKLQNAESRSASNLNRELQEKNIDVSQEQVDLSGELPRGFQGKREWAARKALVEFDLDEGLEFQGTGDLLVRKGDQVQRPDPSQLIAEMFKNQLSGELDKLLNGAASKKPESGKWLNSAIVAAEREGVLGFRVTRVSQNLLAKQVSVESRFVARIGRNSWETIWKTTETVDITLRREQLRERIEQDEQVRKSLDLIKSLGLNAGQDRIQLALQVGAATMEAQENTDADFFDFSRQFSDRLDGPPLYWLSAR